MNPACVVMRPNPEESIDVESIPLNFAVFVRLRISNRISPTWVPANRVPFDKTKSMFLRN